MTRIPACPRKVPRTPIRPPKCLKMPSLDDNSGGNRCQNHRETHPLNSQDNQNHSIGKHPSNHADQPSYPTKHDTCAWTPNKVSIRSLLCNLLYGGISHSWNGCEVRAPSVLSVKGACSVASQVSKPPHSTGTDADIVPFKELDETEPEPGGVPTIPDAKPDD